jgi:hypothetical protein
MSRLSSEDHHKHAGTLDIELDLDSPRQEILTNNSLKNIDFQHNKITFVRSLK